ncbi:XRE family transcriptional regulator [Actinoplanes sp. NPDC049316]|uniref:XRE family transcriptional regulator n=1 Tax=Actinoplanes sp. NPDC049316 TaxID=3154727 RepID=UPI00343CB071
MNQGKPEPNSLLMQARRRRPSPSGSGRPMSRQELAEAINLYLWQHHQIVHQWDETDIGRLERGENRWPGRRRREAFRAVLQVAADHEIGFYISRSSTATSDATAVDQLVLAQLEPSAEELLHGSGVGRGEWSSFALVTSMLAQQRQAVPPSALLSLVEAHRDCLLTLYRKAGSDSIKADIGAMLGEASIVASRLWSAQGNHTMALAHCGYARTLADRSGDVRLAAVARIFESNLHSGASTLIHADGDVMTGLRLLDEASTAGPQLTAAARARISAEQAQAYAALHLPRQAQAALDQARQHAAAITNDDRTGLFSDWNTTRVQVYEGTCYLLLDEPTVAIEQLESVAAALGEDEGNLNVALAARVDLAAAYGLTGQLDAACTTLGDAYEQLRRIGNLRGIARAQRARESLSPWNKEPAVREMDQRIAAA